MNDTGPAVSVRYRKWDGRAHWSCETIRTADDQWGTWLYSPTGTELARPGRSFRTEAPSITLVSTAMASTPTFWALDLGPDHLGFEIYCDVTTRPVWADSGEVGIVDLDLDVVRLRTGETAVLDEEEFAEHRVILRYPEEIVALARASCAQVFAALCRNDEPYASVGRRRLDEAIIRFGA